MGALPEEIMSTRRDPPIELFQAAVEAAPTAILIADGEGRIVLANRETERQFDYSSNDLVGQYGIVCPDRF